MSLLQKLTYQEELQFQGDYPTFLKLLQQGYKPFYAEWFSRKELKIYATTILGGTSKFNRISCWVYVKSTHNNPLTLQFKTTPRWEFIILALITVVSFGTACIDGTFPLVLLLLLPLFLGMMWWVFRLQEMELLAQFKKWLVIHGQTP